MSRTAPSIAVTSAIGGVIVALNWVLSSLFAFIAPHFLPHWHGWRQRRKDCLLLLRTDATESEQRPRPTADAPPKGTAAQFRRPDPTAPSLASHAGGSTIDRIRSSRFVCGIEAGIVPIPAPLPDVAGHVMQSKWGHALCSFTSAIGMVSTR